MKNRFIATMILLFFSLFLMIVIFIVPKVVYLKIVNCDYQPFWYYVEKCQMRNFQTKKMEKMMEGGGSSFIDEKNWRFFHIGDFKIKLPFRNPLYEVVPKIRYDAYEQKTTLALEIVNRNQEELNKVTFNEDIVLKKKFDRQKLFTAPYVLGLLVKIPEKTIWKDLFSLKIKNSFEEIKYLSFKDLVYSLYIWDLRSYLFNKLEAISSTYYEDRDLAVLTVEDNGRKKNQKILFLNSGIIESYTLKTNLYYPSASEVSYFLMNNVTNLRSYVGATEELYQEFQKLTYDEKIDQEGMLYLLSAFSHQQENKKFLEDIIYYLEKGAGNLQKLRFFYSYARERYGKDFMDYASKKLNDLNKKIGEEIRAEDESLKNSPVNEGKEGVYKNHEERSKRLLDKSRKMRIPKKEILKFD